MRNSIQSILTLLFAFISVFAQLVASIIIMVPCLIVLAFRIPPQRQNPVLFLFFASGWLLLILIGYGIMYRSSSTFMERWSARCASVSLGLILMGGGFWAFGGKGGLFVGQMDVFALSIAAIPGILLISQGLLFIRRSRYTPFVADVADG